MQPAEPAPARPRRDAPCPCGGGSYGACCGPFLDDAEAPSTAERLMRSRYTAFALRDRAVTSLATRRDAFDDWFDAAAHAGDTAIIVADRWRPLPDAVAARFASITEAAPVEVVRFGRLLARYRLYVARDFAP